ncbi:MAG: ABC transporter substrate-binding protein [Planctomycetes bacterium]|nr:ABC transporter substrate-binding protein [Planctomycetota bacterium]
MKAFKIAAALIVIVVVGGVIYHGLPGLAQARSAQEPGGGSPTAAVAPPLVSAPAAPSAPAHAAPSPRLDLSRIVATDGAVTEIMYALGFGDRIIAADSTAKWPAVVAKKPSIGYVRRLSAEGLLSLNPTLILNTVEGGPPEALEQLRASGVPLIDLPGEKQNKSFPAMLDLIEAVGAALEVPDRGKELAAAVEADLEAVRHALASRLGPKALFIFNPSEDKLTAGGGGTGADEFFKLANLPNVAGHLENWKPLSKEAVLEAGPELLVAATRSEHQAFGTTDELLKLHGLDRTPAGQTKRVIFVDGIRFLAGGPRVGEMAHEFAKLVHPDLELPASRSAPWFRKIEERFRE